MNIVYSVAIFCIVMLPFYVHGMQVTSIRIRGHEQLQSLPVTVTHRWPTWTFDEDSGMAVRVEDPYDEKQEKGWVNPTSFDRLFLPEDLPIPRGELGLGIGLHNGVPRYIFPSCILSLETPDRVWRNRGLCSLPRASGWLDLFAPFTPPPEELRLCAFAQVTPDVRFLEDIDGTAAWQDACSPITTGGMLQPTAFTEVSVGEAYSQVASHVAALGPGHELAQGFNFVDVPLRIPIKVPPYRLKMFLSNVDEPMRLLEVEEPKELDVLTAGELTVDVSRISAGGTSEFLPPVYRGLYDEGAVIMGG